MWTPSVRTTRRAAARLVVSHRAGGITLKTDEIIACIDAISHVHLSRKLCMLVGKLWYSNAELVLIWESDNDSRLRDNPTADETLNKVARKVS